MPAPALCDDAVAVLAFACVVVFQTLIVQTSVVALLPIAAAVVVSTLAVVSSFVVLTPVVVFSAFLTAVGSGAQTMKWWQTQLKEERWELGTETTPLRVSGVEIPLDLSEELCLHVSGDDQTCSPFFWQVVLVPPLSIQHQDWTEAAIAFHERKRLQTVADWADSEWERE